VWIVINADYSVPLTVSNLRAKEANYSADYIMFDRYSWAHPFFLKAWILSQIWTWTMWWDMWMFLTVADNPKARFPFRQWSKRSLHFRSLGPPRLTKCQTCLLRDMMLAWWMEEGSEAICNLEIERFSVNETTESVFPNHREKYYCAAQRTIHLIYHPPCSVRPLTQSRQNPTQLQQNIWFIRTHDENQH
jgi:hypothetical protein